MRFHAASVPFPWHLLDPSMTQHQIDAFLQTDVAKQLHLNWKAFLDDHIYELVMEKNAKL